MLDLETNHILDMFCPNADVNWQVHRRSALRRGCNDQQYKDSWLCSKLQTHRVSSKGRPAKSIFRFMTSYGAASYKSLADPTFPCLLLLSRAFQAGMWNSPNNNWEWIQIQMLNHGDSSSPLSWPKNWMVSPCLSSRIGDCLLTRNLGSCRKMMDFGTQSLQEVMVLTLFQTKRLSFHISCFFSTL